MVKFDLLFIRLCFARVLSSKFDDWGHCQIGGGRWICVILSPIGK